MKHLGSIIPRVLATAAMTVLLTIAGSVQATDGKAVTRAVRGSAKYKTATTDWTPLKVGTVLRSGAIIQTAAASQVDLFLGANGPVVRVTESTEMALDKLTFQQTGDDTIIETQLDLKAGTLLGNVKKLASASKYEVKTPNGVAGIRGTEYKISASGKLLVLNGTVHISYLNPSTGQRIEVDVHQGETFIPPTATEPHQIRQLTPLELADFNRERPRPEPEIFTFTTPAGVEVFVSPINNPQGTQNPPPHETPPNGD